EVPRAMDVVSIAVGRGPAQDISVSLLDRAQKSRAGSHDADSANVRQWVQRLADDSPAVATLALHCLSSIRSDIDQDRYAAWSLTVDGPILSAMERLDGEAEREAWACLIHHGPMPPECRALIRSSKPVVQHRLIRLTADEFKKPSPGRFALPNAVAVLGAVLASEDAGVAGA